MAKRAPRRAAAIAMAALLLFGGSKVAEAEDDIDLMLQRGQVPADMMRRHGYSDFTEPLGKFLDLLAAGSFAEARLLQPDACAAWLATRQTSAMTGKFWIWNTEINLDRLCTHR